MHAVGQYNLHYNCLDFDQIRDLKLLGHRVMPDCSMHMVYANICIGKQELQLHTCHLLTGFLMEAYANSFSELVCALHC